MEFVPQNSREGTEEMADCRRDTPGEHLKKEQTSKGKRKKILPIPALGAMIVILFAISLVWMRGSQKYSIYQTIVNKGYTGTQEQWLASLVGEEVDNQAITAYELAVQNGYTGSESTWMETIVGSSVEPVNATTYQLACKNGFDGSLSEWLTSIAENPAELGRTKSSAQKTEYELACEYGYSGTFTDWLVSVTHDRVFE